MKQTRFRLLTLLAILLGFALRLYHLGAESLWYDETVSVALAQKSIPALIRHTAGDIHPPGYYLLLHGWQTLTHPTPAFGLEFLYAWPSVWCGVIILVLLFAIGRQLLTAQVALLALWLAALNPYHIWYSQEVRMYTLGAMCGLFCLWALLQWWQRPPQNTLSRYRWLVGYIGAGAGGLYTLYYFLFALIALNGIALWLWRRRRPLAGRVIGIWVLAQGALLALWLPWLPIFWRQITDPPVPPWRTSWATTSQLLSALAESASALVSGQSAPAPTAWLWLLIVGIILLLASLGYTNKHLPKTAVANEQPTRLSQPVGSLILLIYLLVPVIALIAFTLGGTPLYHVRYLFTYAPPLMLLLATALFAIFSRQRLFGGLALSLILLMNGWSLYQFWFAPAFRTDDHRGAVAQVATAWRPGDVIVVNAGWVYTALTTYWPTDLIGVDAALPPPLARMVRLIDVHTLWPQNRQDAPTSLATPLLVRTGSVDGAPSLGWGDPASDFFAMRAATTTDALNTLARHANRLWHYRLYDTVNDPQGFIRTWLETHNNLLSENAISGRDYLRVQLYQNRQTPPTSAWTPLALPPTAFAGDLTLQQVAVSTPAVAAGTYLYTQLTWQPPVARTDLPPTLSFSLRLYTEDGHLLAQADDTPLLAVAAWPMPYVYTMALPIPVATPPGTHQLQLIVYDQQTGIPLAMPGSATPQQALPLGPLPIAPATHAPVVTDSLGSFDYIDLIRARLSNNRVVPGAALDLELIWRPQENSYRDTYLAQLVLQNAAGESVAQWTAALGGWRYPSGGWPPLIPVRDWRTLLIAPTTPPGQYTLVLQVRRDSDKQLIPARYGWWSSVDTVVVGDVEVLNQ